MSYQFSYMKVWQGQKTGIKLYLMLWMVEIDNKCSVVFFWDPCKLLCYTTVKHNFLFRHFGCQACSLSGFIMVQFALIIYSCSKMWPCNLQHSDILLQLKIQFIVIIKLCPSTQYNSWGLSWSFNRDGFRLVFAGIHTKI